MHDEWNMEVRSRLRYSKTPPLPWRKKNEPRIAGLPDCRCDKTKTKTAYGYGVHDRLRVYY